MSNHPFATADFFVLRTPGLPLGAFQEDGASPGTLRERLRAAIARPEVREALFIASPDLEAVLEPWAQGELAADKAERVDRSLIRYLTRMCSRSTPFGLFAGCAVGAWGRDSNLAVPPLASCRRHTRLDMDYLETLVETLERDPELRTALAYRPNTSLHRAAGRWHYVQPRMAPGKGREHHLVALDATRHLDATLAGAEGGATLGFLAAQLARQEAVELAEAEAFLAELVDGRILTSDLHPPLTGGEPLPALVRRLGAEDGTRPLADPLHLVQQALSALDEDGVGNPPARYQALARTLTALPAPMEPKHLFQVDLYKPSPDLTLSDGVRQALEEAVERLRTLTPPRRPGPLARFRETFRERYDTRSVPLLEALDPESGLGFDSPDPAGSPLLEGLPLAAPDALDDPRFTTRDGYVLGRLQDLGDSPEWALEDRDLAALAAPEARPFPDGFSALAALAAESPQALAEGRFQVFMERYSGPSGAQLLGRFCHGDPVLEAHVRAHLAVEEAQRPGVLFAELVHQPEGRIGNILSRPALRGYEIPFLGASGVPEDHQIPPQDLRVSLQGNRFVLHSARLGLEVVPRLTSAQNFRVGLPVFRFLAQLQDQEGAAGGWDWGPLAQLPFLPRVRRGRHVLARARWRVEARELKQAGAPEAAFQALRAARLLPRHLVLEDADNTLWVDLDQPPQVTTLLRLVAGRPSFTLVEAFPGPDELAAHGPEGRYCHELVVPFQRRTPVSTRPPAAQALDGRERSFPPGSAWLYLKLYTGPATADRLLPALLASLREALPDAWDRWFFIRYADPAHHLRLRFHGDPARLTAELLPRIHRCLEPEFASGACWKLELSTYERELERYGGRDAIPQVEAWFEQDSECALESLGRLQGDDAPQARWQCAFRSIDAIFEALGFPQETRLAVAERTRDGLAREFPGHLSIELGARFRTQRKELEALLREPGDALSAGQSQCLAALREAAREGRLNLPLEDLAGSLVHMHVNRFLRTAHRAHEMALADFLARIYRSRLARS